MKTPKYIGLKTGAVFSILSFLFSFTISIPIFSVMHGIFLEQFISNAFPDISYENTGIIMLLIFGVLFLSVLFFILIRIKILAKENQSIKTSKAILIMLIFYAIVHPLGYYLLMWFENFPVDALNAMMSVISFLFSSLAFVIIGFLMDWLWKISATYNAQNRNTF